AAVSRWGHIPVVLALAVAVVATSGCGSGARSAQKTQTGSREHGQPPAPPPKTPPPKAPPPKLPPLPQVRAAGPALSLGRARQARIRIKRSYAHVQRVLGPARRTRRRRESFAEVSAAPGARCASYGGRVRPGLDVPS